MLIDLVFGKGELIALEKCSETPSINLFPQVQFVSIRGSTFDVGTDDAAL